jgi:hypothetical protein
MTVALYQGDGAEEVSLAIYSNNVFNLDRNCANTSQKYHGSGKWHNTLVFRVTVLISICRHPNFGQIYEAASTGGIHAAIFHDGLNMSYALLLVLAERNLS